MNETLLKKLKGRSELYPNALEQQFPRVFEKIIQLWDLPNCETFLDELLVDKREGKRAGFPPEVASEIMRLTMFYANQHQQSGGDMWGNVSEKQRYEVEQLGFKHTPEGFMQASETGNMEAIKLFLSSGVSLETRDERDWTPLMISSFNGKEEAAILLIKCGAKVEAKDKNGYSPIHWAAFNGYNNVVVLLIKSGANPNALSNFGWTAMMQAASRGHLLVVAQLIAGGAHVNIVSKDNWTALHKAAANGNVDLVRLLLTKGADPTIEYQQGCTALTLARRANHDGLTLARKADYDAIIAMLMAKH